MCGLGLRDLAVQQQQGTHGVMTQTRAAGKCVAIAGYRPDQGDFLADVVTHLLLSPALDPPRPAALQKQQPSHTPYPAPLTAQGLGRACGDAPLHAASAPWSEPAPALSPPPAASVFAAAAAAAPSPVAESSSVGSPASEEENASPCRYGLNAALQGTVQADTNGRSLALEEAVAVAAGGATATGGCAAAAGSCAVDGPLV